MDGRGLAASLVLGAQGVQMGTRFLTAVESGAHEVYKQARFRVRKSTVIAKRSRDGLQGNPQCIHPAMGRERHRAAPFPTQNTVTRDIRNVANRQDNPGICHCGRGKAPEALLRDKRRGYCGRDDPGSVVDLPIFFVNPIIGDERGLCYSLRKT